MYNKILVTGTIRTGDINIYYSTLN